MLPPRYPDIFNSLNSDSNDDDSQRTEVLGRIAFGLVVAAAIIGRFVPDRYNGARKVLLGIYGFGFFAGLFIFLYLSIKLAGQNDGKRFGSEFAKVISRTFLILILPALVLTLITLEVTHNL